MVWVVTRYFLTVPKAPILYDVSGRAYIDYVGSWGPMIAGHANPDVLKAVHAAAAKGLSFGAPVGRRGGHGGQVM